MSLSPSLLSLPPRTIRTHISPNAAQLSARLIANGSGAPGEAGLVVGNGRVVLASCQEAGGRRVQRHGRDGLRSHNSRVIGEARRGAARSGACLGVPLQQRLVGARHQAAFPQVVFPLVVVAV